MNRSEAEKKPFCSIRRISRQNVAKIPWNQTDFRGFLVRVAGFEPTASWTRISLWSLNGQFRVHVEALGRGETAICSSESSCLRSIQPAFGSRFGSRYFYSVFQNWRFIDCTSVSKEEVVNLDTNNYFLITWGILKVHFCYKLFFRMKNCARFYLSSWKMSKKIIW